MSLVANFFSRPANCLQDLCFCELVQPIGIAQTINSWSSLSFLVIAVVLTIYLSYKKRVHLQTWIFVLLLSITGIGSFYYHAKLSFLGQTLDVFGMYLIITWAIFRHPSILSKLSKIRSYLFFLLTNLVLLAFLILLPETRRELFATLVICFLFLEFITSRQPTPHSRKYLQIALALLACGYSIWLLDYYRVACIPQNFLQGHAVWHILTAISSAFLYLHLDQHLKKLRTPL